MPHSTTCWRCHGDFDALEAEVCFCIGSRGSVVCPQCSRCFCSAPLPYWKGFWAAAPQELWDRRRAAQNPPADDRRASSDAPLAIVVEDHALTRKVAIRTLERLRFRVLDAADGEAGLALVRQHRPTVVLTDALLPKLDGRELCLRVKDDPSLTNTRVLLMTNVFTSLAQRNEALQRYRADGFLAKPVSTAALQDLLRRLLGPLPG